MQNPYALYESEYKTLSEQLEDLFKQRQTGLKRQIGGTGLLRSRRGQERMMGLVGEEAQAQTGLRGQYERLVELQRQEDLAEKLRKEQESKASSGSLWKAIGTGAGLLGGTLLGIATGGAGFAAMPGIVSGLGGLGEKIGGGGADVQSALSRERTLEQALNEQYSSMSTYLDQLRQSWGGY